MKIKKDCLERLTDAYFYKGVILYDQGQEKDAIVNVKKSRIYSRKTDFRQYKT